MSLFQRMSDFFYDFDKEDFEPSKKTYNNFTSYTRATYNSNSEFYVFTIPTYDSWDGKPYSDSYVVIEKDGRNQAYKHYVVQNNGQFSEVLTGTPVQVIGPLPDLFVGMDKEALDNLKTGKIYADSIYKVSREEIATLLHELENNKAVGKYRDAILGIKAKQTEEIEDARRDPRVLNRAYVKNNTDDILNRYLNKR